jgi:predicted amidophosphoribosyltransferase
MNYTCTDKKICCHVSQQDAKAHQCNLISNPTVLVRLLTQRFGDNPPPVPHWSRYGSVANVLIKRFKYQRALQKSS